MLNWKEKIGILFLSLVINLAIVWLYVTYVKPEIDAAAKGMAIMILQNSKP